MTDSARELLERAAKAARVDGFWVDAGLNTGTNAEPRIWNPLTDDGDALRLAVKLRLSLVLDDPDASRAGLTIYQTTAPTSDGRGPWYWKEWNADAGGSEQVATRRAIVMAAAALCGNDAETDAKLK